MPYYKIAYSIAFVVILSAIQPVVYANEIGQAVERAVSLLAVVFCADTYLVEVQSKRSEVFCLYNLKKQAGVVYKILFVQVAYLIGISFKKIIQAVVVTRTVNLITTRAVMKIVVTIIT